MLVIADPDALSEPDAVGQMPRQIFDHNYEKWTALTVRTKMKIVLTKGIGDIHLDSSFHGLSIVDVAITIDATKSAPT